MSLKVLHKHIFAAKLRELLARSEILCVYQALSGDVSAAALAADANARLPAGLGFRAEACRMRNAVAAATGDPLMETLFRTSNVIVGFAPEAAAAAGGGVGGATAAAADAAGGAAAGAGAGAGRGRAAAAARARLGAAATPTTAAATATSTTAATAPAPATAASTSIRDMLAGLLPAAPCAAATATAAAAAGRPPPPPHLPQAVVRELLAAALELPTVGRPLALLGAFYRRAPLPLAHMREWRALDAAGVHASLVGALGGPAADVLAPLDALLSDLAAAVDADAGGPGGVVAALEHRAASSAGEQGAAGA